MSSPPSANDRGLVPDDTYPVLDVDQHVTAGVPRVLDETDQGSVALAVFEMVRRGVTDPVRIAQLLHTPVDVVAAALGALDEIQAHHEPKPDRAKRQLITQLQAGQEMAQMIMRSTALAQPGVALKALKEIRETAIAIGKLQGAVEREAGESPASVVQVGAGGAINVLQLRQEGKLDVNAVKAALASQVTNEVLKRQALSRT
jgi:hypothetical protein